MAKAKQITDSFTRPADVLQYADGDMVANSNVTSNVTSLSYHPGCTTDRICKVRLTKSGNTTFAAAFVIYFYSASPTTTAGDNALYQTDVANFIGSVSVGALSQFTDGAVGVIDLDMPIIFSTGNLYALIEVCDAYTPVSGETFTVDVWIDDGR